MKTRAAFSMDGSGAKNTTDPATVSDFRLDKANLGTGDCNNDLTTSTTTGDMWTAPFTGTGVSVYAPKESGAGKIEIQVDGQMKDTVDLSASGARQPQQLVFAVTGLTAGRHFERTISNPYRETEHDP